MISHAIKLHTFPFPFPLSSSSLYILSTRWVISPARPDPPSQSSSHRPHQHPDPSLSKLLLPNLLQKTAPSCVASCIATLKRPQADSPSTICLDVEATEASTRPSSVPVSSPSRGLRNPEKSAESSTTNSRFSRGSGALVS